MSNRNSGGTFGGVRPRHGIFLAVAAVLAAACLVGGLMARYVMRQTRENEMVASGFHISSNALKESTPSYTAICGTDGTFAVELYNYEVENTDSVSEVNILYTVSVTNGTVASVKDNGLALIPSNGKYTLPKGSTKCTHVISVTPTDLTQPVTVTVATTSPYVKTLSASFSVSGGGIDVERSDLGGSVTLLTIHTNQYEGTLTLSWASSLQPNVGVNEAAYGWRVGYDARTATQTVNKQTTYYYEFNTTAVSGVGITYSGTPSYTGATIAVS